MGGLFLWARNAVLDHNLNRGPAAALCVAQVVNAKIPNAVPRERQVFFEVAAEAARRNPVAFGRASCAGECKRNRGV